jgi:DNA-binding IclR family transcriptional regulator
MGRPVAAISVAGVTDRISPDLSRIGAVVASTAEAISRRLGYDPAINYATSPTAGT